MQHLLQPDHLGFADHLERKVHAAHAGRLWRRLHLYSQILAQLVLLDQPSAAGELLREGLMEDHVVELCGFGAWIARILRVERADVSDHVEGLGLII